MASSSGMTPRASRGSRLASAQVQPPQGYRWRRHHRNQASAWVVWGHSQGNPLQGSVRGLDGGDGIAAFFLARRQREVDLLADLNLFHHGLVGQLEVHHHARPVQRRDRIMVDDQLALGRIHTLNRAGGGDVRGRGRGRGAVIMGFPRQGDTAARE